MQKIIFSKENIEFGVNMWHRIRGNALRRNAGYLILAAIAAQSNLVQYLLTASFALCGANITLPETPSWIAIVFVLPAGVLLIVDRLFPEKAARPEVKRTFNQAESLADVLRTGEDIIRRQRIMATSNDWEKDPTIGVRNDEGALWREAVRRHVRDKHPNNPVILRELDWVLDIDRHIFDEGFNRSHGTRVGFIESYLNHSYRIQSFGSRSPSEPRINGLGKGRSLYMTMLSGG